MASPSHLGGILLYLLLVATTNADNCNKGCPRSDNGLLKFTPGNFYEYAFESILTIGLNSGVVSEADDSSLKVTGSAKIYANGNCGYTLQVGSVKVINTKESVERKILNNIQKPVHFTLVNGQLQSQICTDASDSAYSLNVKRAIISLLQSDTGSDVASEVDVYGLCPTHTSSSKSGNAETVIKVRNLNNCAHREQISSGLLSGIVNEKAGVTSSSLFQSDYSKESKIERGVVANVHLVESYKFAGMAKGNSDVTAKVVTTLKLKNPGGTSGSSPTSGSHASSIIFQKSETYPSKNIAALKVALSDLVDLTSDYIKKDSAKKFVELIRLLRHSDTETLLELSTFPHPNKVLARKVYLDALFRTNTAEAAKAILKQLNKFDEKEKIFAILSLNLIKTVDKETLNLAAAQLSPNVPKETYLAVGNLVSKYCAKNGCQVSDIDPISKKFVDGLKHCKPNTKKDEERIVYILKGIGNAENLANNVASALNECASPGRSNRIRVAALQAFSAISCNEALRTKSLDLLKDHNEDSELRIEAYMAAINCPTAELANQISEIVNSEKVYQVGGFIESNLRGIRDSTDATRHQQRYYLGNIRVTKHFPKDYRRYSFNNEFSYKLDSMGISASSDYKLIYSQHGFLPRSARLNVTSEIFGTNFNVFEASIRQENLENLLEYYVGPKGLLNKDFDEIVKLIEVGNSAGRARRSIADDVAKTAKKYKTYGSKNVQDVNLDLSLKLFGSEMAFLSLGDNIPSTLDDIIKHFSEAFDKAKKELSSFEKQFACHHLFLDSEFTYPTGIGVPLEFAAQGFAANKIDFAVNIDVNAILEQNWQRAKYRLKFVPSVDVNVNIQLGFNAQVLSTGLRVVSSAHSATGSDVSISLIKDGDGFNVNVDLPREKIELIDVQVNTEFFVAEQDKPQKSVPLKSSKKQKSTTPSELCFNQLEIVGLNVCVVSSTSLSDINASNTNKGHALIDDVHLSRPFTFAIFVTTERKFSFKGTHSNLESGSQQWKLEYSTPGSKVSHDTSVAFELGTKPRTYGRLSLDNPQFHLGLEAGITNDNHELVIYGQYEQDKNVKKSKIGFAKNGNEYKPVIEIQDKNGVKNNINGYHVDGKIIVQKTGDKLARYNFQNFQLLSPNNERVVLNGWAEVGPTLLNAELRIAPNQQSYLVKSNFKLDNGQYALGLFVNDEQSPENVYGSSAQLSIGDKAYELKLTGKAVSWAINSETQFEYINSDNSNALRTGKFSQNIKIEHKNKLVGSVNVISTIDVNKFQFDAEAVRDQKLASLNVKYQSHQRSIHDYELSAKAKLNKHSIDVFSKCDFTRNIFVVDNSIATSWGTSITAKGELGQRYSAQDVHIDLQGTAQFGGKKQPIQWILKVLGTPEKTNSEFRISRDNAELAKLTSESQHPQDKIAAAKPKGQNKALDFSVSAHGDFIEKPLEVSVVVDEYSAQHAIAHFSGKYGDISVDLNGKYNMGHSTVPATYEFQGHLQVPDSKFKKWEMNSHGKLLKPADSNGAHNLEFVFDTKSGDGQFTRINTIWKGNSQQGSYTFDAQNNNLDNALKFDGSYQREQSGSFKDGDASGKQKYAIYAQYGDKYIKTNADISYGETNTDTIHYTLDSSYEAAKDITVDIRSHKIDEGSHILTAKVKQADKAYGLDTKLFGSTHKKGFDMRATLPSNQPIVVVAVFEVLGDRKAKLTLDIDNLIDLDFKLNTEASYTNIDDFYVIGNWNSKKLHLDSYALDVKAHGKNIKVHLKSGQTVVFLGTATYTLKKEQNKAIIEGQGQVQYLGKPHTGSFKLIRQHFDLSTEKEVGFAYTFNGSFGPKNGVSMLKITNKEFNTKLSICEEKKQCSNIQVQSSINIDEQQLDSVQHDVLILVDLRELGYPYELQLKSKNNRQGFKNQYNLDGHILSGNNLKYQLTANVMPTATTIKLTLPKRQILFETTQRLPTDGKLFGHYEQSAAFYIDKLQRPNDVARVLAVLDISGVEQVALNAQAHFKVEHPTIRPLSISAKVEAHREQQILNTEIVFDIFRSPEQKVIAASQIRNIKTQSGFNITSNQQIRSSGLQFQYELNTHSALIPDTRDFSAGTELQSSTSDLNFEAHFYGNKDRLEISVNALNEKILYVAGDFDWQKRAAKINSKLQVFGQKHVELNGEVHPNWAKVTLRRQNLIDANAEVKLGKEFQFDVVGTGKPIFNGRIALDPANFLQTTYKTNDDDVTAFLTSVETEIKKETDAITENVKKRFENIRQRFDEKLKLVSESSPDLSKLRNNYGDHMNTIIKELESDPSLAPIIDAIRTLYEKINKVIIEITKTTSETYEKLHKSCVELYEKLNDLWKDSLLKAWEQFVVAMTKLVGQLRIEIVNALTKTFKDVIACFEKYGPALKNYVKAINESLKPFQEVAQDLINVIVHAVEELSSEIKEYIAKLPTFESIRNELRTKLEQFKVIEKTLEFMNNIFEQLNLLPQTPESAEFLQKLNEYLQAKLKKQPLDDEKWLDELSKLLVKAARSLWESIRSNTPVNSLPATDLRTTFGFWPHSVDAFAKLPALLSFRSSIINFVLNENWEHIFSKDLFSSWLFFQDFELHGHIIDGQHIFTFDGQNFAYPGNCKYILAQDGVDNNFTVSAQLNNGKLKGITLVDQDGNYMEVSDTVALKVNGKPVEYPQHLPGIHAWRRFYTVHLHSEYGVNIVCTTDLKVCHVNVNGFYTSKTRGLLGNGNAEPYDDYLLIDGTLASNYAGLGNEYGVGKCSPVAFDKTQLESPARNDICSDVFGIESPLALNYLALDSKPYRQACDFAMLSVPDKDKEAVACTFALAYGSALKIQNKWVLLPSRCLKCAGAVGQRELGEEFTVKIPTNKADVVFIVDVNVNPIVMANLIAPAITEIRESLKVRGFTDVQVGVIVFDETKKYPALLTSDNGKINYKGNVANFQLNGPKHFCENCVEQIITDKRILDIYNVLKVLIKTIVPQSDEKAFDLVLDFPFRAAAAKSIIGVRSNSLDYNNWLKFVRSQITGTVSKFNGALLHLIAPIKGLALEGVPAEKLVGFNARLVATLDGKDNKKRTKLQFVNDMGIDLVLNNGGWAFDTENFNKLKPADQKKVLSQVTSSIADTLFKTETVSDCRCLPVHGLHGQHKCAIKSTSFVPNKKPKSK
ncbi:GH23970 [Drosophila grimshawi]|uniref:GH23970 n=1 Tax=Drosophila grimshawi TaxID=7222 RepID=B4JZN6_DROGR|nr:GH23970 [Drosophila grimshawi]